MKYPPRQGRSGGRPPLTAIIDTNVLVRHLIGDPPEMAARATAYLGTERELLLTDLIQRLPL